MMYNNIRPSEGKILRSIGRTEVGQIKSNAKREEKMKKPVLLLKSGLHLILCDLAAFVIVMFFQMCYIKFGGIMCVLFGFCSVGACICIYGDFAWKLGIKMRHADDRQKSTENSRFGLLLGLVPTAINYIFVLILFLSKFGVIKYDFFPLYKTLTLYFVPVTYFFAPNRVVVIDGVANSVAIPAADLGVGAMIVIALLPLVFLLTNHIAYSIGYNRIDVKEKILYGK